jgi:hypothetical protein
MLGPAQLAAFLQWLSAAHAVMPDRPKFVFAGQILAPLPRDLVAHPRAFRTCDGFFGYPGTLRTVIAHIVVHGIRNLVFVGGDQHLSSVSELTLSANGAQAAAWQIVASGLYAPARFANSPPARFAWQTAQTVPVGPGNTVSMTYTARQLTADPAHFVQVRIDGKTAGGNWGVAVTAHGRDGTALQAKDPFTSTRDQLEMQVT